MAGPIIKSLILGFRVQRVKGITCGLNPASRAPSVAQLVGQLP